jgi:hypothetical protein
MPFDDQDRTPPYLSFEVVGSLEEASAKAWGIFEPYKVALFHMCDGRLHLRYGEAWDVDVDEGPMQARRLYDFWWSRSCRYNDVAIEGAAIGAPDLKVIMPYALIVGTRFHIIAAEGHLAEELEWFRSLKSLDRIYDLDEQGLTHNYGRGGLENARKYKLAKEASA